MIYVALCDDDINFIQSLQEQIEEYFKHQNIEYEILAYHDATVLDKEISQGKQFDMFWLDIEMSAMNGMELAKKIKGKQPKTILIFVSNYPKYSIEAHKVKPHRFVPKESMDIHFEEALESAVRELQRKNDTYLLVNNKNMIEKIDVNDIFYVERSGKYVDVILESRSVRMRMPLKEMYQKLPKEQFIWGNKGQIVNLEHIKAVYNEMMFLENGVKILLVRGKIRAIKECWVDYCLKRDR